MKKIGESIVSILILILCVGFFSYFGDGLFNTSTGDSQETNTPTEEITQSNENIKTNLYLGIKKYGGVYDTNPFENATYYGWIDDDNGDILEAKPLNDLTDVQLDYGINLELLAWKVYSEFKTDSNYFETSATPIIEFDSSHYLEADELYFTISGIRSVLILYEDGNIEEIELNYNEIILNSLLLTTPTSKIKAIAFNYDDLGASAQDSVYITYPKPTSNTLRITFYEDNKVKFSDLYVSTSSAFISNKKYADYVIYDFGDLIKQYCNNKSFDEWVIENKNYILINLTNSDIVSASYRLTKDGYYLLESTPKTNGQDIGLKWSETYE